MFNPSKGEYEQSLTRSGYSNIILSVQQVSTRHVKRQRHRNNIWLNPHYSGPAITTSGKKFFQLVDLHFPTSNKFYKIFKRNDMTVSYYCTQVVRNIKSRKKKLINSSNHHAESCNCRKKDCRLEGKCRTQHLITLIKHIHDLHKEILKKDITILVPSKMRHKGINMFGNLSRNTT